MLLLLHIMVALGSLVFATYLYVRPSRRKLYASYGLTAATLGSGTYLVISTDAAITSSCMTGLVYFGTIMSISFTARRKLARLSLT